jgi:hypothetical protein
LFSIGKLSVILLLFASLRAAAETPLWEPGKVAAVEQVSLPARTPDRSCQAVPRGETPPLQCRASYLRAEHYWRVTVDVGQKRFVVRPYRAPGFLDALGQGGPAYVDPNLTVGSSVEVAVVSSKAIRIRADQGQGILATIDSEELLSKPKALLKTDVAPPSHPTVTAAVSPASKVVLLESSDFLDMEVQEFKSQDIGDGAALYSFTGDSSPTRISSNPPVFLVLAENAGVRGRNVEVSRLQLAKGTRQLLYFPTKNRSASSLPIVVTQVSATVRKVSMRAPLPPGEYVVLLENSNRGFLFGVR